MGSITVTPVTNIFQQEWKIATEKQNNQNDITSNSTPIIHSILNFLSSRLSYIAVWMKTLNLEQWLWRSQKFKYMNEDY